MAKDETKKIARIPKSIPWEEMRARFFADNTLTLAAIAREFGVASNRVRARAAVEKWRDGRDEAERQAGHKLWTEAKRRIRQAAAANALALLADLRRVSAAVTARYVTTLTEPEYEEEKTGDIMSASAEAPIVGTEKKTRRSAVNLPRLAAKLIEQERIALKDFLGIESPEDANGAGSRTREVTFRETIAGAPIE